MGSEKNTRSYVSQSDIPRVSLKEALRIPQAIAENYALEPVRPLRVAEVLDLAPNGGRFRELCGAAIGFGLTEGGAKADQISLTPLGRRIVAPTAVGDDERALQEAALTPTVVNDFLRKYDGSPLPPAKIAANVLTEDLSVPRNRAADAFEVIDAIAEERGFLREVSGSTYVDLGDVFSAGAESETDGVQEKEAPSPSVPPVQRAPLQEALSGQTGGGSTPKGNGGPEREPAQPTNRRVFITHGKNKEIVGQLKELLAFGDFEPVVSVEKETVSKPVPEKVMDDMRSCSAAIIHVGSERKVLDDEGNEHLMLNPNVLVEIGAAMALYKDRFILLVEDGIKMPSNLQGLYEVRFTGKTLDHKATMKLLKAFNDFKK